MHNTNQHSYQKPAPLGKMRFDKDFWPFVGEYPDMIRHKLLVTCMPTINKEKRREKGKDAHNSNQLPEA